jgi:cytochrome c553
MMQGDLREALRRWLAADAEVLDGLSDQDLAELHAAIASARKRQARALAAATDEAMRQLPALVRASVARIVGR